MPDCVLWVVLGVFGHTQSNIESWMQCWAFNCILIQKIQKLLLNTYFLLKCHNSLQIITLCFPKKTWLEIHLYGQSLTTPHNTSVYKGGHKQGWPQTSFSYILPSNTQNIKSCPSKHMQFLVIERGLFCEYLTSWLLEEKSILLAYFSRLLEVKVWLKACNTW